MIWEENNEIDLDDTVKEKQLPLLRLWESAVISCRT